jgi:hypothetical protein
MNYHEVQEQLVKNRASFRQQLNKLLVDGEHLAKDDESSQSTTVEYILRRNYQGKEYQVSVWVTVNQWGKGSVLNVRVDHYTCKRQWRSKPDGTFTHYPELIETMLQLADRTLVSQEQKQKAKCDLYTTCQFLKDMGLARYRHEVPSEPYDFAWEVKSDGSVEFKKTFKPTQFEDFKKFVELVRSQRASAVV